MSSVTTLADRTTPDALNRLYRDSLIDFVQHSRSDTSRIRRWYMTRSGTGEFARLRLRLHDEQTKVLIRRFSISAQARRYLLQRMDVVSVLYRVAQDASAAYLEPITWRWERQGGPDALMQLPDGRCASLNFFGTTAVSGLPSRLGTVGKMRERKQLYTALVVVPGPVEMHRALNLMKNRNIHLFIATEQDVMRSDIGSPIWHRNDDTQASSLRSLLQRTPVYQMPKTRQPTRTTLPAASLARDTTDDLDFAPTQLTMPARRLLRTIFDWPLMSLSEMRVMMGISESHMRKASARLSKLDLVHYVRLLNTKAKQVETETRLVLSENGLEYLALADRSDLRIMNNHWLFKPSSGDDEELGLARHIAKGTKGIVLLKEREHTEGVYEFISLLADACRKSNEWSFIECLPSHRYEKHFRYGRSRNRKYQDIWRSIKPDSTIVLRRRHDQLVLFLEFERRADTPKRIAQKIDTYRNYFASKDTDSDFPNRPGVLFCFEKPKEASGFVSEARRAGGSELPILVSSLEQLRANGLFSCSWSMPWRLDAGPQSISVLI